MRYLLCLVVFETTAPRLVERGAFLSWDWEERERHSQRRVQRLPQNASRTGSADNTRATTCQRPARGELRDWWDWRARQDLPLFPSCPRKPRRHLSSAV